MPARNEQFESAESNGANQDSARHVRDLSPANLRELAAEIVALMRADLRRERERLGPPTRR